MGDLLLLIFARAVLQEVPGALILADVKCSKHLFSDIPSRGGKIIMSMTGHAPMKKKLKELQADLAGELAGHVVFGHRFYGFDDACYCAARLAEILSNTPLPVSKLLADLTPTCSSEEIHLACPDEIKFQIAAAAREAFPEFEVGTVDGARISFPHGWALVRASNTQPVLVLRFEADTQALLDEYQRLVETRIAKIRAAIDQKTSGIQAV